MVAATHYDSGRNSVAMISGAKRYILSPPRACSKLGLFTSSKSPIYRHSLLNFAHIPLVLDSKQNKQNDMSTEEREWLQLAATAEAVETVVKAGEVGRSRTSKASEQEVLEMDTSLSPRE